jgi:signal transduction histidine kinase
MGLCAALEWLAQDVFERTGIQCVANLEGLVDELEPDRSTALFRIVQEAITNALKHAQATRISIRQYTRGRRVVVDVKDNGIGVKRSHLTNRKAFGIVGMRERAAAFGGLVEIKGGPRGTRVSVLMPMAGGGDETE